MSDPQPTTSQDELDEILQQLQTATLYADNTEPAMTNNRNIAIAALQEWRHKELLEAKTALKRLIAGEKEEFASKIMLTPSEGLFDDGDLFVRRAPIEQTIIKEIGYEKFKAMQEAANAKELQHLQDTEGEHEATSL